MYYLIDETLVECKKDDIKKSKKQYVVSLTTQEWKKEQETFDMGIEIEPNSNETLFTQAEVNYDSITGTFSIPNRRDFSKEDKKFAFALDEKGIVFIDDSGIAAKWIKRIERIKKWRFPSLERFIYDFLNQIIQNDFRLLKRYENELNDMEIAIVNEDTDSIAAKRVNEIRSDMRDLINSYEELLDFGQVLVENENKFFKQENLRYFNLYQNQIDRLRDMSMSLRDYTMQIRDLHKTHLDIKQNHIMTVLTIVTTIFMPLTLIVGWYGMNFKYMPELNSDFGYPLVIIASALIVIVSLWFFKKKNWL